jgi:hypothetical protein
LNLISSKQNEPEESHGGGRACTAPFANEPLLIRPDQQQQLCQLARGNAHQRLERIHQSENKKLKQIREAYKFLSKEEDKDDESNDGGLLAMFEENYRNGKITLQALNNWRRNSKSLEDTLKREK